jgi:phosphopantothenoylcysteine decarboxylase/phosphopantothenate--cysteine ligase
MSRLAQRNILLGVTGGVAAYKAAELTRLLTARGAAVRVVMTEAAQHFVGPLTFQALSGERVRTSLLDEAAEAAMGHIELARWADAIVLAPASADTLARLAQGLADDLLSTIVLASEAPLAVAPAMNRVMWAHPATRANVATLGERGASLVGPDTGDQACGETGVGRMLEPEAIADALEGLFRPRVLAGQHVLITAGPTQEAIDPVRYLTNASSGRMGFAVADAAARAGATVTLVAGPSSLVTPAGVERLDVTSAVEMHAAVMARIDTADVLVATAAVADHRPAEAAARKLKKGEADTADLALVRNPDILADVGARSPRPVTVGFAAEADDVEAAAEAKRQRKGADLICANRVGAGQGFGDVDTRLQVFGDEGHRVLGPAPKPVVARRLVELIGERLAAAGDDGVWAG